MTPLCSPVLQAHAQANAPALARGAVDYDRVLCEYDAQWDFFDSRRHLATVASDALAHRVRSRAAALSARGLGRGDRVVMIAANEERYLTTLLAVLLLGAVPCSVAAPATPARRDSAGVRHLAAALAVTNPKLVLAAGASTVAVDHAGLLEYGELEFAEPLVELDVPQPEPGDIHHLQLTSGSTSEPKVVALTHSAVAHNMAALGHAMRAERSRDAIFSWLPMYHDMGLIQVLGGLAHGLPIALMNPLGFLRDPLSWLRHMTVHRSTITAGPTFAYRAAVDALTRSPEIAPIDLSALRHAFVGAEPIHAGTLRSFTDTFAGSGLRPEALVPCYGMAESVLATTLALSPAPDRPGNWGRVRLAAAAGDGAAPVSCGPPIEGMRIEVLDPAGRQVGPGEVGDVRVGGPSLMAGYLEDDGTISPPEDGWHDTGDRGFLCDGELFITGRKKEMLIIRGRNLPPYDIERTIGEVPEVGPGHAVVFSVPDAERGRERVVAVVGVGVTCSPDQDALRSAVAQRVRAGFGIALDEVVLVPRRAIPRTTSGKVQRLRVRERYLSGEPDYANAAINTGTTCNLRETTPGSTARLPSRQTP